MAAWDKQYDDYLKDESRRTGTADGIAFPATEAEVVEALRNAAAEGQSVTVQGARTGVVAGAVPDGGLVLNLSRMNSIGEISRSSDGSGRLTVQPGAILSDVQKIVQREGFFFPPDPTETSASIGGMVASNSSGAMSFFYGPTRDWISSVRVVLADGDVLVPKRGEEKARGRSFVLKTENGREIAGTLPSCSQPDVKSAAGYFVAEDMDLIDLFIGMEGTLGVVTEVELKLIPHPRAVNGLTVFLPSEDTALRLVRCIRGEHVEGLSPVSARPVAIEFFNHDLLSLLRRMKSQYSAFEKIPALKPHYHTAVYLEFHGESDEALEEAILQVMEVLGELGLSDDETWFATTERELEPLKAFRHAAPEAVNLLIDERRRECPDLTKLATDMSVPDSYLEQIMHLYNTDLAESGLESAIWGHIGNNHVHVNILPHTLEDYDRGKGLYLDWARRVVEMCGSVSAEHGIGKLKVPFLRMMYAEQCLEEMKLLRRTFDPAGILNPGNLFG